MKQTAVEQNRLSPPSAPPRAIVAFEIPRAFSMTEVAFTEFALALLAALAARYTRQDEVTFQIGRRSGVVDSRTLIVDLTGDPTFRRLLAAVSGAPRGDACFSVPSVVSRQLRRSRLAATSSASQADTDDSENDVTVEFAVGTTSVTGVIEYNVERFDEAIIRRLAGHLANLWEQSAADPDCQIFRMKMLTDQEARQVIVDWNDTDAAYSVSSVPEALEQQVVRTPANVALIYAGRQLRFDELNARANQLGRCLARRGVIRDVLVGVCLSDPLEAAIAFTAVLKAGGAYVPLDPEHPPARLNEIIEDARLALVVTTGELARRLPLASSSVLCVDSNSSGIGHESTDNLSCHVTPDDAAYVIYTSGSTGKPKGVVGLHRTITSAVSWATPFRPNEVCCLNASMSFTAAMMGLYLPLLRGRPVVVIPEDQTKNLMQLVELWETNKVTRIIVVPPQLRELLRLGPAVTSRLHHVTTVGMSGAALTPDLIAALFEALPQTRLINAWSSSEVGTMATRWEMTKESDIRPMSIGRPIANTRVYILDKFLNPVPPGVVGELFVASPDMSRGYLNQPDLTNERFIPNPFGSVERPRLYRSGDLGRYLEDGEIEFFGRIDHQVKIRGVRIELGEIETVLETHADVQEAVVTVQQIDQAQRLVAYVVGKGGVYLRVSALRTYLSARLPAYMVPSAFVLLERLPYLPNGKIDRNALPLPSTRRPDLDTPYTPPRNPIEAALAEIWARVLNLEDVGIDDHFLELGGDSLLAVQLLSEIQNRFGMEIPLLSVFERPTIALLAEHTFA